MVNLEYVGKRKRNRLAAIISGVTAVVVTTFVIVSFLGQKTGSYTISLKTSDVNLALSKTSSFEENTSFLRVEDMKSFNLYCFRNFKDSNGEVDFSTIDTETTPYNIGARMDDKGEVISYNYFKYTFFVKNLGTTPARYDMDVNIISESSDRLTSKSVTSFLRTAVIDDGDYTIYAKRSNVATHYADDINEVSDLEYIDGNHEESKSRYEGLAEPFVSNKKICRQSVTDFMPGQVKRYTMLFWLEGDDAEATGTAPEETKLRLGVEIQAYEN